MAKNANFEIGSRVMRSETQGPLGTVYKVRVEKKGAGMLDGERQDKGVTISVLWDNGTQSHFIPEGLAPAK